MTLASFAAKRARREQQQHLYILHRWLPAQPARPTSSSSGGNQGSGMDEKKHSEYTDQESMEEAGKVKPSPIVDALLIGFLIGIVIYSVVANTWGLLTLIPLFLVYRLVGKSKRNRVLKK